MEIKAKIREIVENLLEKSKGVEDDTLLQTVGLNSINFIQLIVALEDDYDIDFNDEDMEKFSDNTINSLVEWVQSKL